MMQIYNLKNKNDKYSQDSVSKYTNLGWCPRQKAEGLVKLLSGATIFPLHIWTRVFNKIKVRQVIK